MFTPKRQNPLLAAGLILCATAFIAASTLFAKTLSDPRFGQPLHPFQISHGRYLFAFLAIGCVVLVRRPAFTRISWRTHATRTGLGWAGVSCMFAAVAFIPMADATAISFLNPVFAMILAVPLLKERVGPWRWLAAIIALVGALILLRPTPASFQPAALLALAAAVFLGLEVIVIKRLAGREGPLQILFINNMLGLCIASVAVLAFWAAPTPAQWGLLVGVGLCMAAAQTCFVNGMARGDASFVAPFSYATLIFAAVFDAAIFGVIPDMVSRVGATIILMGAFLLAWREARLRKA